MNNLSLIGIFLEGLLSFLSPCVLPLLPLYMSYLAGADKITDEQGNVKYKTSKVFISTLFFVLGICFTLALFAISVNVISNFLNNYKEIISIICGTVLIIFGLHEMGVIHIDVLDTDARFKINLHLEKMNFIKSFLLGFVFSLGWSPCIGPMLANALMLVASESLGYLYIVAYGLGLVIPFLITGLLTSKVLNFINSKKDIMKWVLKIAGIIMICFGIYMIGNGSSKLTDYKVRTTDTQTYLLTHKFEDKNGKSIRLSDYKGKYVIVNFTTTWCSYCAQEVDDYLQFSKENDDVVCLYAMSPSSSGVPKDELVKFANEHYELNVLIDEGDELATYCNINGYPTKLVIASDGTMLGCQSGALTKDTLDEIMGYVRQTNK